MADTGTPLDTAVNPSLSNSVNPALAGAYRAQTEAERTAEAATGEAATKSYAAEDTAHQQFQLDSEESGRTFQSLQDRADTLAADKYKPPTPEDPLKSYGAVIAGLMGVASGFSHGSMIASLNAGASAITAAKQGNTEEYQRKFDEWKTNHDLMKDQLDFEAKAWTVWQDKLKTDHSEASAYATALAARTGNTVMAALNRKGDTAGMAQVIESTARMQESADQHATSLVELNQKRVQLGIWKQWQTDNPNASPAEMSSAYHRVFDTFSAAATEDQTKEDLVSKLNSDYVSAQNTIRTKNKQPLLTEAPTEVQVANRNKVFKPQVISGNESVKIQDSINAVDNSLQIIDRVTGTLNKYVGAAGIAGRARRLGESASNIVGSNQTDLVQFRRDISTLQMLAPQVLGTNRRLMSAEAGHLTDIIAGLSPGDTTANTLRAMQTIRGLWATIRTQKQTELMNGASGEQPPADTAGTPAPPAPAQDAQPWLHDR